MSATYSHEPRAVHRRQWKQRCSAAGVHLFDRDTGLNVLLDEVPVPAALHTRAPQVGDESEMAPHSVASESSVLRRAYEGSTRSQPVSPDVTSGYTARGEEAEERYPSRRCILAIAQHGLALGSQSEPSCRPWTRRRNQRVGTGTPMEGCRPTARRARRRSARRSSRSCRAPSPGW